MSRNDFIDRFRHEIDGWVLDAAMTNRTGADLSVFLRMMRGKIESKLGIMWEALQFKPAAPANGKAPTEVKR